MKKFNIRTLNIITGAMIAFIMFLVISVNNIVYGASATVSISSASVTQGNEVKVTVTVSADANIGAYNFYLEYDASVLQVVSGHDGGGGGRIQLQYDVPNTDSISKKLTKTITFKAIAPGTSAIKYVCVNEDDGVLDYDTTENMSVTPKDGSITVKAPVVASKNNNLVSMSVAAVKSDGSTINVNLTPGFSKDVTSYNLKLEEGVTKLVISAKTEDAKANVKIQWANLDPGDNTTKVIVTAEDGSAKTYTIRSIVEKKPETTTPAPEPITVVIDGAEQYVESITEGISLPEGFETFEYDFNGRKVIAGRGLSKDLIVLYITKGNGSAGALYIYNETEKSYYPMVNIQMTQKLYTVIKKPADVLLPKNFTETTISIDGVSCDAWKNEEFQGIYLIYAMNWNGQTGLYYYDEAEKQMLKYFDMTIEAGVSLDEYNSLVAENEQLKNQLENGPSSGNSNSIANSREELYKYIAIGCAVAVVILIGVIIIVIAKNKKKANATEEISTEGEGSHNEESAIGFTDDTLELEILQDLEDADEIRLADTQDEAEMVSKEVEDEATPVSADVELEDCLKNAMEYIIKKEEALENEFSSELTPSADIEIAKEEATEEKVEPVQEEVLAEEIVEEVPVEETSVDEKAQKRDKVDKILNDADTSIDAEDIDLVIDELFSDLFDE